jgi:hypothetical protein
LVAGIVVAIPALFMNLTEVTDLTSIGTLFAFVVVCAGVLFKEKEFAESGRRYVPYISSRFILPVLFVIVIGVIFYFNPNIFSEFITLIPKDDESMLSAFSHKIPSIVFLIVAAALLVVSQIKKMSLIPILGLLSCLYLMTELGITNWLRFGIWLLVGLVIYIFYGMSHSKLNDPDPAEDAV